MPEGWSKARLGDFLTDVQLGDIISILSKPGIGVDKGKELKDYLRPHAKELLAKGMNADYFAYWLLANAAELVRAAASQN